MARMQLTQDQLREHLREQIGFLKASAVSFDAGHTGEAKRMAVTLRVLLHQTAVSHSLLGLLGIRQQEFVDSAYDYNPRNLLSHHGLVGMSICNTGASYVAFLDDSQRINQRLVFSKWWDKLIIVDQAGGKLTRKQLVLAMSNQDGGAHVDPSLDEVYHNLKLNNSLGWIVVRHENSGTEYGLADAELFSVRQIAHEVLRTLDPEYPFQSRAA